MLVANPITYDGRVRRHAAALAQAGHDVAVIGVLGPNDRDVAPLGDGRDGVERAPRAGRVQFARIDRRPLGVWPRLRWLTTAVRQRLALQLTDAVWRANAPGLRPGLDDSSPSDTFGVAVHAQLASLAVATSAPELALAAVLRRPDMLYAHDLDTVPAAAWAAAVTGTRFLYDAHELYVDEHPALTVAARQSRAAVERYFAKRAAAIVTVNDLIADDLARRCGVARPVVVRNLPRAPEPTAVPVPNPAADAPAGRLRLLYHGAHVGLDQHGVDDILRALVRLRAAGDRRVDATLTLRGGLSPQADRDLRARIADLGLQPAVLLVPRVPGAEALVQAAIADGAQVGLAVHPPLCQSYVYTTSSKLYEYQWAGLAVCASDVLGNRHTVPAEVGLFYPAGDDAALAGRLRELAWDPARLMAMRVAARRHAETTLRWDDEAKILQAAVDRCR